MKSLFFANRRILQFLNKCPHSRFSSSIAQGNKIENCDQKYGHTPVMSEEVIEALNPKDKEVFIDMTFGAGGHTRHLLNAASIKLYCLDRDPCAYEKAVKLSKEYGASVIPLLGKFSEMQLLLTEHSVKPNSIDGILIDAGCSSMQMDSAERGFSVSKNGPLDMRMDGERFSDQPTAADVLNNLDVPSLVKIFKVYGEEKHAKKIAQALFDAKYMLTTINTTHELAELVQSTLGCEERFDKLNRSAHVATKIFQALRIFVNDELNELNYAMEMAHKYLRPGGKVAVLTFHSLEDRIIKRHLLGIDMDEPVTHSVSQKYKNANHYVLLNEVNELYKKKWKPLYKNVITASEEEIDANPRSRSAKLRVAEKISDS
ncbi:12S rRNA N4-methylcytidine methyltransferase [Caerostris darwini]|uniref:12S rRNA N4-methylcytidine methyltransferase n=1 Tax=Caerostris darwini TaxID=1538125 RepID=A0AAV4W6L4_9ARAC|nr:12S rRNA N4-methylcytidine methyltransferase [Caerostris darwini]